MRVWGIAALLLLATLGRGGHHPAWLLAWHGLLLLLLLDAWLIPRREWPQAAPRPAATLLLTLFFGWALFGALHAPDRYAAWTTLLEIGAFAGAAWLAAREGEALESRLRRPLLAAAALLGLVAILQRVASGELRPAATFLNPNHLGAWLSAALLLAVGTRRFRAPSRENVLLAALALPALAGLWLSGSRGAQLGFACGVAWLLAARWREWSRGRRAAVLLVLLGIALLAGGRQLQRFRAGGDPYALHRTKIWSASLQAAGGNPWFGSGAGQFPVAARNLNFPDGRDPLRYERSFSRTHSDLLRLPAEFGWPAALCALAALAAAAAGGWNRPRLAAGNAALLALGVQAAVADNLSERPALYLLAAVLLGIRASRPLPGQGQRDSRAAAWIGAALAVFVFLVGDVAPYRAWAASHELPPGALDLTQRRQLFQALRWNPLHAGPPLRVAGDLAASPGWGVQAYAEAREWVERALRRSTRDADAVRGLARIEAQACRSLFRDAAARERAAAAYRRAFALSSRDPSILFELAAFLLTVDDSAGALREARRGLELEPQAVPGRLLLAEALLAVGGPQAAKRARSELAEARRIAERYAGRRPAGEYDRWMLALDEERAAALERRLRP